MPGFSIVKFLTEQTVEVVPSNWVVNKNVCWWPASTGPKLRKLITDPESEPVMTKGVLYSAKILKTYENYSDAIKQLPDAERTSNLETESDDKSKKSRKERKRKQFEDYIILSKRFEQYEPEDSDEDSPSLLTGKTINARNHNDMIDSSVPFFDLPSSTIKTEPMDRDGNSTDQAVDARNHNDMIDSSVPFFDLPSSTIKTETLDQDGNSTDQAVGFDIEKSACSCDKVCSKILEEIKSIKQEQSRFQEIMLNKVVKLENDINEALRILGRKDNSPPEVLNMPASFPLQTLEEINLVESWLSNVDHIPILIQHFSCIGGTCVKDTSRRVLGRIFKGEVCSKINWMGKNGKYAIGKTCLSKVIISSVRLYHPDSTEKDVEDVIKAWFRFSKDREGGRDKRRSDRNVIIC